MQAVRKVVIGLMIGGGFGAKLASFLLLTQPGPYDWSWISLGLLLGGSLGVGIALLFSKPLLHSMARYSMAIHLPKQYPARETDEHITTLNRKETKRNPQRKVPARPFIATS
ncbi:MAG: hypothetical protein AAFR61_20330 [Bacteroidota bacterium]